MLLYRDFVKSPVILSGATNTKWEMKVNVSGSQIESQPVCPHFQCTSFTNIQYRDIRL